MHISSNRITKCCGVIVGIAFVFAHTAEAAKYEIVFEEGAYRYEPSLAPDDVGNKYLARITIKKDGQLVAKDLRGSTLPDAWIFYQRWNVELKNVLPPSDADVVSAFDHFEKQTAGLRGSNAKLGATSLADLANVLDVLNRVPALGSGEYPFAMGLHKDGQSVHGKPYVPRLLGGTQEKPYDSSNLTSKATVVGGFIRTLNRNNAQAQKFIAAGINVHDGRFSKDYKDSEGCLTVHPADWKTFYGALPSPEEWLKYKHAGIVSLKRKN